MNPECRTSPKPESLKELFRSWYFWKPFLGIIAGAAAGYLFYFFVGCESGSCFVTDSPLGSIITGGVLGFLVTGLPCLQCNRI